MFVDGSYIFVCKHYTCTRQKFIFNNTHTHNMLVRGMTWWWHISQQNIFDDDTKRLKCVENMWRIIRIQNVISFQIWFKYIHRTHITRNGSWWWWWWCNNKKSAGCWYNNSTTVIQTLTDVFIVYTIPYIEEYRKNKKKYKIERRVCVYL